MGMISNILQTNQTMELHNYRLRAKSGNPSPLCYYILSPGMQRRSERDLKRGSYVEEHRKAQSAHVLLLEAPVLYREV